MNSVNVQQWEAQQTKAFKNWANYWLRQSGYTERKLDNVMTDVADGVILINLYKALSGEDIPRYVKNPALTAQKIENLSIALNAFKEYGIVANVAPEDFLAGKEKFILGYLWRLIQKFQILHSTRAGNGAPSNAKSIRDFVLEWVKDYIEDYPVKVDLNASSPGCFSDGWLLSYMIHKTDNSLIDLKEMEKKTRKQRIETAFELAAKIGVPEVIDAGDLLKDDIEEKVLLVYLTSFKTASENYQKQKPETQSSSKPLTSKGSSSTSSKPSDGSKGTGPSSTSSTLANAKPQSSSGSGSGSGNKGPGSGPTSGSGSGPTSGAGNKGTGSSGSGIGSGNKGPGSSGGSGSSGSGSGQTSGAGNKGTGSSGSGGSGSSGSGSGPTSGAGNKGTGSSGSGIGSGNKGPGSSAGSSGNNSGSGGAGGKGKAGPGVWDSIATKEQEKIQCPICEKFLSGRIVCVKTLDNKEFLYHSDCWICSACRQELLSLGLDFYLLETHPYCAECYHRAIDRVCAKCGKIAKDSPVRALGKVWHATCFVCNTCGCTFSQNRNFYNHNGTPYCEKHFKEVEESENICARCGKGISGDIINALGKKWHDPDCWVCQVCSGSLDGKFYNVDGFPRCADCARK